MFISKNGYSMKEFDKILYEIRQFTVKLFMQNDKIFYLVPSITLLYQKSHVNRNKQDRKIKKSLKELSEVKINTYKYYKLEPFDYLSSVFSLSSVFLHHPFFLHHLFFLNQHVSQKQKSFHKLVHLPKLAILRTPILSQAQMNVLNQLILQNLKVSYKQKDFLILVFSVKLMISMQQVYSAVHIHFQVQRYFQNPKFLLDLLSLQIQIFSVYLNR